jgi:hypothetical protein
VGESEKSEFGLRNSAFGRWEKFPSPDSPVGRRDKAIAAFSHSGCMAFHGLKGNFFPDNKKLTVLFRLSF